MEEPVDLGSVLGIGDIAFLVAIAQGIDDRLAGGVENGEVRVASGLSAESGHELLSTGGIEMLGVTAALAYVEADDDEVLIDDGGDLFTREKAAEHVAGAAPGGGEKDQDVLVFRSGLSFGLRDHLRGVLRREQGLLGDAG